MGLLGLLRRDSTDADGNLPEDNVDAGTEEIFLSWTLFIVIVLLIASLWTSYYLQQKRIKGVHESIVSIVAGILVGFIIRVSPGHFIQEQLSFSYSYFFNILLPPIILNSGYELNQANFFRNIFSILMFAFAGTFIATVILGALVYVWTALGLEGVELSFVDAVAMGATLSATDPVTILSIFNTYQVDPKLYTIIFGESLLNDAVCIVIFETCTKFRDQSMTFTSIFAGIGIFFMTFTISLLIGVLAGILSALVLKHTHVRRYPQIESCLVLLFSYGTYFFSNGCHMSGIVSLLFCGITLKHYAYYNMSRRTQLAVKYTFQLLAQLAENFIFIYLGLTLLTQDDLVFRPLLIIVTAAGICLSRYCSVFPLSRLVNQVTRFRARMSAHPQQLQLEEDEIPPPYQFMLFWAGLRGAVGVALAAGIEGPHANVVRATVLVVVVLTVVVFGGTTAQMLEILGIRTGVAQEQDSDDEFDLELPRTQTNRQRPVASSSQTYVDDENDDDEGDNPVAAVAASVTEAGSKWFSELDSKVFKPVLLDDPR